MKTDRLFFLDWLRIAAFGLLVLYHVGMYYVSWDWHVKSPFASDAIEPLMLLSSPWRLGLLFLVSGAATSTMLLPGTRGFLGRRSAYLLMPLACGMVLVVPPQPYLEVVEKLHYAGSYLDFLKLYFTAYDGFCRGADCLDLPTWNHLWFVAYLWVYTVVLWVALQWRPRLLDALAAVAQRGLQGVGLITGPVLLLALWRLLLLDRFPPTNGLVDDLYNHALYGSLFLLGAVVARAPGLWPRFGAWRFTALAGALALWALLMLYYAHFNEALPPPGWLRQVQRAGYAALQWTAIVATVGFAYRHWNRDHRWRSYLVEAVFPVYLLHQTITVVLAHAIQPLGWAPAAEGPLLVAATFGLSFAGYELVRRVGWLRPWFGLKRRAPAATLAPPAAHAA